MTSLYIHWPFCVKKCPYCDFNSHLNQDIDIDLWLSKYISEIDRFEDYLDKKEVKSIFFGGGTPSLMPPIIAEKIIDKFSNDIEVTLEANPNSTDTNRLKDFKLAGINRVSIGVQSFNEDNLKFLGRAHNSSEAKNSIEAADKIFNNYSFDLIYSLPNQTIEDWERELNYAQTIAKHHLSIYQLTIEKGTQFYSDYKSKKFKMPDDDISADFYNLTQQILKMPAYEISNHAKPGYESAHNLNYWQYGEYLGIGPGAHSRIKLDKYYALEQTYNPNTWLKSAGKSKTLLSNNDIIEEIILMGLRLTKGISKDRFKAITGKDFNIFENLQYLINNKFLEETDTHIRINKDNRILTNSIIFKLLS